MTTNITNSQAASIAHDNEFHDALMKWLIDGDYHIEDDVLICKGWDGLISCLDAKLAQARDEGFEEGLKAPDSAYLQIVERAKKAESRLAEIQRGVEGLTRWRDEELCYGKSEVSMIESGSGEYLRRAEVLALLQPPGQADTSGLPG